MADAGGPATGKLEEAARACREAIRIKPDLAEAYNNLGNVLAQLGRPEEGEKCFRAALALGGSPAVNLEARYNLSEALAKRRRGGPDD